jgi:hypothetical protein
MPCVVLTPRWMAGSCRSDSSTQFLINQSSLQNHSILILMSTIVLRATSGNLSTGWFNPYRPRLQVFFNLDFSSKIKVCLVDSGILDTLQQMHRSFPLTSFLESHNLNLVVSSIFDLHLNFHTNVFKCFSAMHTTDNGLAQNIHKRFNTPFWTSKCVVWYNNGTDTSVGPVIYILDTFWYVWWRFHSFFFNTIRVYIPCKNLHTYLKSP